MGAAAADATRPGAHFGGEQVGLFPGGEVAASFGLL
jgi:hypothetical protein